MAENSGARSIGGAGNTHRGTEDTHLGRHTHDDKHGRGGHQGGLDTKDDGRHTGRTPAQWYCLLAGAALLLAGIFGFIADATFDAGSDIDGDSFLGFEVNGWHNVVHLLSGLVLLSAFGKRKSAKTVALAFGVVYGLVTIIGLIDGNDVLGIIPVNPADNILHLALSALGIISALVSPTDEHRSTGRGTGTGDTATTVRTEPGSSETGRFGRDVDPLTGRARDDSTTTRNPR